jgi:uncharacterized protein involved in exopolysaccharide biosynthesis
MNSSAASEIQQNLQLIKVEDYVAILKRRKFAFAIPFVLILAVGILLAYMLPPVYRSEAAILIERQEIPEDLVETTVTGFVQERIQGISKRLLTRENLWSIAEKLDLYSGYRSEENRFEIVTKMQESIVVDMVDVKASDPGQVRQGLATIAFTVAFESDDPEQAQTVANELAALFIEENKRLRSQHTEEVSEFLVAEGERLNKQITDLEVKLADFKQAQQSSLPELMKLNLQLFEKTDSEIERTKEEIRALDDRIIALQAELAITKPNQAIFTDTGQKVLTGNERLSLLTTEYLRLSARYSAQHPDLIKLRREIEALGGESNVSGVTALIEKLTVLKERLSEAKRKYSNDHPDVISLQKSVAAVERGLQTATVSSSRSTTSSAPDNPRYVSLKTQLGAAVGNLKSEKAKLAQLNEKLEEYETRLFQTPAVERDYKFLTRDYDNATKKYNEIKNKQSEARLAMDLESSSKGQRFTIVQPAYLPNSPERPNRLGIALLGFLLASAGGIGVATIREYMDNTIYSSRDLAAVFRAPPLVTIPHISN